MANARPFEDLPYNAYVLDLSAPSRAPGEALFRRVVALSPAPRPLANSLRNQFDTAMRPFWLIAASQVQRSALGANRLRNAPRNWKASRANRPDAVRRAGRTDRAAAAHQSLSVMMEKNHGPDFKG